MKIKYEEVVIEVVEVRDLVTTSVGVQNEDPEGEWSIPTVPPIV